MRNIHATSDGGFVFVGWMNSNALIGKFSYNGSCEWMVILNAEEGGSISNGFSVVQNYDDSLTFVGKMRPSGLYRHIFVAHVLSNGSVEWVKKYDTDDIVDLSVVLSDNEGGFVVSGRIWTENSNYEMFIIRFEKNGSIVWAKVLITDQGSSDHNIAHSVVRNEYGGFTVVGSTKGFDESSEYSSIIFSIDENGVGCNDWVSFEWKDVADIRGTLTITTQNVVVSTDSVSVGDLHPNEIKMDYFTNSSFASFSKVYCRSPCDLNYYGPVCEVTTCNGFFSNSSVDNLCQNHGECVMYNGCECEEHYFGKDCEISVCYGHLGNKSRDKVCGGHGSCVDFDECICDSNYRNILNESDPELEILEPCSSFVCYGTDRSSGYVCSERGKCVGFDHCVCFGGYEGDRCDTFSCGSVDKNNEKKVCSGKGECFKPSKCKCKGGYSGDVCQTNVLLSAVMAPILTISGISGIILIACCCFSFCCVCFFLMTSLLFLLVGSAGYVLFQKFRLKRFEQLKNFDLLLHEQEMEEDVSVAHIRIRKELFQIDYEELSVKKMLGEGGSSSIVYLALWKGREVAFKCFRTRMLCSSQDTFDEFEKEVEVLASVSHPHILQFFGCVMSPPRVGIVMEFCSKGDLSYFMVKYRKEHPNQQPYPLRGKYRILEEIVSSLEYIHARNIIHRDVKLENVLLDSQERAKLMDFGLSRHVEKMSETNKTMRVGTDVYMPPEIINNPNYSEKCDVYSFGILVWIFITENSSPYEGRENVELIVANDPNFRPNIKLLQNSVLLSQKNTDNSIISSCLSQLVQNCWNHNPEKRFSFEQIAKVLEEKRIEVNVDDQEVSVEEKEKEVSSEGKVSQQQVDEVDIVATEGHELRSSGGEMIPLLKDNRMLKEKLDMLSSRNQEIRSRIRGMKIKIENYNKQTEVELN